MRLLTLLFCALALSIESNAQVLIRLDSPSPHEEGRFGAALSRIGDQDLDGIQDALIGAPGEAASDGTLSGRVHSISATTGARIHSFEPPAPSPGDRFGTSVAASGDLDEDEIGDVLVGAPGAGPLAEEGRAYVYSGASGSLLFELASPNAVADGRFGQSVARVNDIDGDAISDLLVGAPGETVSDGLDAFTGAGRVHLFSGASGDFLFSIAPADPQTGMAFGSVVDGGNDYDGDGVADLIIGVPGADLDLTTGIVTDAGQVRIYSGTIGALIRTFLSTTPTPLARLGRSLSRVGDRDGDESGDVLVGERGKALISSGTDGTLALKLDDPSESSDADFGRAVAGTGDVDGDARLDLAVSAPEADVDGAGGAIADAGRLYILSSASGASLLAVESLKPETGGAFGDTVIRLGDVSGDNVPDLLVGAPGETSNGLASAGHAYIVLMNPPPVSGESAPEAPLALTAGPNPTRGALHLRYRLTNPAGASVTVIDVMGREVAREAAGASGALTLDARGWAPGVYLVRLASASGTASAHVTVVR